MARVEPALNFGEKAPCGICGDGHYTVACPDKVRSCDEVPGQHHCWHGTHALTTNPPITVETCCWCGKEVRNRYAPEPTQHGRFA